MKTGLWVVCSGLLFVIIQHTKKKIVVYLDHHQNKCLMPANGKTIKILIVDDEKKACTNLKNILFEFVDPSLNIVGSANSTVEAESLISKLEPDAIFLDIEMPNENAFHFLERISPFAFEVIFVTAYEEYAIRAFRLNAIDYILKPISITELRGAVQKLKDRIRYKKILEDKNASFTEISDQITNKTKQYKITLKDINNTSIVDFKDIYFVEAQGSYSRIVFLKNHVVKEMILSNPLSEYEELLPDDQFYRIHRSYLINCAHIKQIISDGNNNVIMKDNLSIPVSRRRYASLIEFLETHDYL
ncbi:MAG: response regulator transcription factor [Flavipsychrobacter sp.]|jgi:two-component system LytT family response regulator|nr:response regulator transcription factor [Flavipsychrobacter sp.]